jgi:hypothetical protein
MASYFQITINSPSQNRNLVLPASTAKRGQAFQESATQGTAELADGTMPLAGFVMRDVATSDPGLGEMIMVDGVYPVTTTQPGLLAFRGGKQGAFENAEEIDCEGSDYIDTGITADTALKTELMFTAGKFALATSGHYVEFVLNAKPTARDSGNTRIVAARCPGHLKP